MSIITPRAEASVPTGTFTADTVHSSLGFEVRYMGIAFFKGAVKEFGATLADGKLAGAARIESLETKDENLHAHLLAPEFFDAAQHPEVTFSGELVPPATASRSTARSRSRASRSRPSCAARSRARRPIRTATPATGST